MKISPGSILHDNLTSRKLVMVAALIALAAAAVYFPAINNDFVDFDDDEYVIDNPYLRLPWSKFFGWMFTSRYAYNWHPLTWLSLKIDYSLWKLNPVGYHLTNVVLHGLNVFLLTLVIARLFRMKTGLSPGSVLFASAFIGVLFGVHPLHVESVAWISERKDVLFALFWLVSVLFYLKYVLSDLRGRKTVYYVLSLGAFGLSLMSKQMGVTLPVVLILLDWYPLGRLAINKELVKIALLEKIPYFVLSIAASLLVIWAQGSGGTIVAEAFLTPWHKFWVAVRSVSFYLEKTFAPVNLKPFYPLPEWLSLLDPLYIISLLLIVFITAVGIVLRKRAPVLAVAWAYFIISLLPVLGIIKVGFILAADRYMYLPILGPLALLGAGGAWAWNNLEGGKRKYLSTLAVVIALVLSGLTIDQIKVWSDSLSLRYRIGIYKPELSKLFAKRGYGYMESGQFEAAIKEFTKAISIDSGIQGQKENLPEYYSSRGNAYFALGDYEKALADYETAISEEPDSGMHYFNRALAYKKLGYLEKAVSDYKEAISLEPDFAPAYNGMGTVYASLGRPAEAIENFDKAISLSEDNGNYYYNRGRVYEVIGNKGQALKDFRTAARLGHEQARDYLRREGGKW